MSKVCKEWLTYLNDDKLIPEVPIVIHKSNIQYNEEDLHKDKLDGDTTVYYNYPKHTFTVDAVCKKRKLIKEFNGCFSMVAPNVTLNAKLNTTEQWNVNDC